ncbi:MAG: polymer-forming cytoskeletal protein, partial [Deltaproteobacteria bacterium]|nr:polymer-forming cytoskeletal protein [Deltaproteobacteria bacterium]
MAAISKDSGAATLIGPSIVISGKISGDEDLTVRGRVEGTLELSRGLVVDPGGIVKADVSAKSAVISGVVVGNIRAEESVELTHEARVVGDITAPRVVILDGAAYRGRVDMSGAPVAAAPRP